MIEIKNVSKSYKVADGMFEALKNVSLTIEDGDIFGIIGMSGAGKSTLVRTINMLERPTSGSIIIDGVDITKLSEKECRNFRRDITMIFQGFNLLLQRNCLRNVCFPLELEGMKKSEAKKKAMELLDLVGLKDKAYSYPSLLSGGQQQRVAIARALATNPKVLLCDEATSALDPSTTNSILDLIRDINHKLGITVIFITHQMSVVENICKHVAILDNGEVVEQGAVSELFAHPKSKAAQRLVFPEGNAETLVKHNENEHYVRVVFNGAKASTTPMIAELAVDKGILANIVYASTKSLDGKAYGTMLLSVIGDDNTVKEMIEYITKSEDIIAEEVEADA